MAHYAPLVHSIATRIRRNAAPNVDYEELVSYGTLGLLEAADRFDDSQENAFTTYAYYRIRGAIYDGLRNMGWVGRYEYSRSKYEAHANEYLAAEEEQLSIDLPELDPEGAASRLNAIVNNLATIFITSLDGLEGLQLAAPNESQEEVFANKETKMLLKKAISSLDEQERTIIDLYYYQNKSLTEISEQLKCSKSWISRIHINILEKLYRILQVTMV